ncbi:MAG TPA: MBL fold metallo-hydrolase [Gaiellaceae bacterium]|jgi:glyoxylase-like metal-dependent hydrolase (beta-lactamase superfamily II)
MAIEEVHPRIYRIPSVLGQRRFAQWLVVGDERLLLVDSGVDGTIDQHVTPALRELGRSPADLTDVVITHADVDHYGGNGELRRVAPQARIRSSGEDRPWIEYWSTISRERYGWYRRHRLDYDDGTWQWLEEAAGHDTPLDGTIADGETIELGGIAVEIVALPGHSPGHLGVVHHDSRTAVVMDAVLERGLYTTSDELISPPPYGSVGAYRGTIERLRSLRPVRLGTSHYAPVEGEDSVTAFLDASASFVDDLDAAVIAELTVEPRPLEHFWRAADSAVGPFTEMTVELARSVGAHLDDAVAESRAATSVDATGCQVWHAT